LDSSLPILLFVVFAVIVGLLGVYSYRQQQQRLAELLSLAERLQWQFSSDYDYSFDNRYSQFSRFCQGSARYAYNTLTGRIQVGQETWPARMGDFHYQTTSTSGKQTQTHHHHFSYLLIDLPYPSVPDLRIRREGIFDALATAFGFDDIDFESAEFSKRFNVKSSNKKFAYDVIDPRMMEFLLAEDPPAIQIDRGCCCLSDGASTWSAAEFEQRANWAVKFFDQWPRHLVAELKAR
jgi:hypothetical protein